MDWRIAPTTCNAQNASWLLRLILRAALSIPGVSLAQSVPLTQASNVRDCRPCIFSPGGKFPAYTLTFGLKMAGADRSVQTIEVVNQDSKATQTLTVSEMDTVGPEEDFFFGGVDINFDGVLDLMLITRRGTANAHADYWIFDGASGTFKLLGSFPVFSADAARKRLKTYERGGYGGMIYESKEYAFVAGKLTVMRIEKQEAARHPGMFRRVVQQRVNGVMKTVSTQTVQSPKKS